jgi:hypothetical protein
MTTASQPLAPSHVVIGKFCLSIEIDLWIDMANHKHDIMKLQQMKS